MNRETQQQRTAREASAEEARALEEWMSTFEPVGRCGGEVDVFGYIEGRVRVVVVEHLTPPVALKRICFTENCGRQARQVYCLECSLAPVVLPHMSTRVLIS